MKAKDIRGHFQKVGTWVDWNATCDQFLHGDPEREVGGMATSWMATNKALKEAADKGLNLFITHEPVFPEHRLYRNIDSSARQAKEKRALMDELGITLLRCHDTWDRMPGVGIPDAWADFLGFKSEERPKMSLDGKKIEGYFKICLVGERTLEDLARLVLEKTKPLGQDGIKIFGDKNKKVSRMAIGTGAISHAPVMDHVLDADVFLATDDGVCFWVDGLWALEEDKPFMVVNHYVSEKPGMMAMAEYLKKQFPEIKTEYIDVNFPYTVL